MGISENDIFVCDFCGEDTGKFNAETGNHVACEELAALRRCYAALVDLFQACSELTIDDMQKIEAQINAAARAIGEYDKCKG